MLTLENEQRRKRKTKCDTYNGVVLVCYKYRIRYSSGTQLHTIEYILFNWNQNKEQIPHIRVLYTRIHCEVKHLL